MLGNAPAFWAIVDRYPRVRALIFGHVHQQQQVRRGPLELFAAPSTAVQFQAGCPDFRLESDPGRAQPGYRYYELNADGTLIARLCRVTVPDCVA
jgi:Icc protein